MKKFNMFILFFYINLCFASLEDKCFKQNKEESCYQHGLSMFMTISSAKNVEEGRKIKEKAAKSFAHGCDKGHQKSCFELGRYHIQIDDKVVGKLILQRSCKEKYQPSCEELKKLK